MDNRSKFSDRFNVLLNHDTTNGIDPYIFNEIEQPHVVSTGGKNIKLIAPKNCKIPSTNRHRSKGKCLKTKIKAEPALNSVENASKVYQHALQQKQRYLKNLQRMKAKRKSRDHTLQYYQRAGDEISDSESSCEGLYTYQRHWFKSESDPILARSSRLTQLRLHLQRQLQQLENEDKCQINSLKKKTQCLLQAAARDPTATGRILKDTKTSKNNKLEDAERHVVGGICAADDCQQVSLPCTRHCSRHIMLNGDQLLFDHCTAKFSDNTQCCIPVFDVAHELPLCPEHARKRDNYNRRAQESKPKKPRSKKPASSSQIDDNVAAPVTVTLKINKSKSRPKKKKRPPSRNELDLQSNIVTPPAPTVNKVIASHSLESITPTLPTNILADENHFTNSMLAVNDKTLNNLMQSNPVTNLNNLSLDIGSLGLSNALKVELDDQEVFASLDHATEHDFEHVLNNLPVDAFNDLLFCTGNVINIVHHIFYDFFLHSFFFLFFISLHDIILNIFLAEGRNGDYEPSREEQEELERAVEAFDKDVRNLERMGQTHGLLEPALLAQLMSDIAS